MLKVPGENPWSGEGGGGGVNGRQVQTKECYCIHAMTWP